MDKRKCSAKIAMLFAIILGTCGISKAQFCPTTVHLSSPNGSAGQPEVCQHPLNVDAADGGGTMEACTPPNSPVLIRRYDAPVCTGQDVSYSDVTVTHVPTPVDSAPYYGYTYHSGTESALLYGKFTPVTVTGSGVGVGHNHGTMTDESFNTFSESVSGDFSQIARITSFSAVAGTTPDAGIFAREGVISVQEVSFYVHQDTNGALTYGVNSYIAPIHTYIKTVRLAPQSLAGLPFWTRLDRVNGSYTAYTSTDGVNWTAVISSFSFNSLFDPTLVGMFVDSESLTPTTAATAVLDGFSLNGQFPAYTDTSIRSASGTTTGTGWMFTGNDPFHRSTMQVF